jgi:hypothetical protein
MWLDWGDSQVACRFALGSCTLASPLAASPLTTSTLVLVSALCSLLQFSFRFSRVRVGLHSSSSLIRSPRLVLLLLALLRIKLCSRHYHNIAYILLLTYLLKVFFVFLTAWRARGLDLIVNSARYRLEDTHALSLNAVHHCVQVLFTLISDICNDNCHYLAKLMYSPHYFYFIHNHALRSARHQIMFRSHFQLYKPLCPHYKFFTLLDFCSLSNVERCRNLFLLEYYCF